MNISDIVQSEIREFLEVNWGSFIQDAEEYGGLDITFAVDDSGERWNYQTGDNSYTGGCYSLPHWGVGYISIDSTSNGVATDIIGQLEEALR